MNLKTTILASAVLLATASTAFAAGPTGFGSIKLGMTKTEVEALSSKDKFHLATSLSVMKQSGKSEVQYFNATITGPDIRQPIQTALGFSNNKLTHLLMTFPEHSWLYSKLRNQTTKKYGAPYYLGLIDDRQCELENGQKYVVGTGIHSELWRADLPDSPTKIIQTSFADGDFTGCTQSSLEKRRSLKTLSIDMSIIDRPKMPLFEAEFELNQAL